MHYQPLSEGREGFDAPTLFVSADIVILAAGTFGSTEILLRSKAAGLPLSDQVGQHFSGNGDMIGFSYNGTTDINMVGFGNRPPETMAPVGPVITSVIDLRHQPNLEDGTGHSGRRRGGRAGRFSAAGDGDDRESRRRRDRLPNLDDLIAERERELDSLVRGPYTGRGAQHANLSGHDARQRQRHALSRRAGRTAHLVAGRRRRTLSGVSQREIAEGDRAVARHVRPQPGVEQIRVARADDGSSAGRQRDGGRLPNTARSITRDRFSLA